jgi:hypothetical protein
MILAPTDKQINFMLSLAAQRPTWAKKHEITPETVRGYDRKTISFLIDQARQVPAEKPTATNPEALPLKDIVPGSFWTLDGGVARVRRSQFSGRLYAERLSEDSGHFEYVKGLLFRLKARMTLEEAKAWGAQHSRCCVCGAFLTDPKSIENGIGPVCAKKV